jgi:hypothetical protein
MGVTTGPRFTTEDVFVDYSFEDVKFRWDHAERKVYRKFYKQADETEVSYQNKLYNEALRFGDEITRAQYFAG